MTNSPAGAPLTPYPLSPAPGQASGPTSPPDDDWAGPGWIPDGVQTAAFGEAALPQGPLEHDRGRGRSRHGLWRDLLQALVLALLVVIAFKAVAQNYRVEGSSMDPSLTSGEYLLVNKAGYFRLNLSAIHRVLPFIAARPQPLRHLFHGPQRGDVVVFRFPEDPQRDFIKRIIGVPGDTVEVRGGTVYVNGQAEPDGFTEGPARYQYGPATVPAGRYFVLGDNRNNSYDSHVWGMVPAGNIVGQAWATYWPLSKLGLVDNVDLGP